MHDLTTSSADLLLFRSLISYRLLFFLIMLFITTTRRKITWSIWMLSWWHLVDFPPYQYLPLLMKGFSIVKYKPKSYNSKSSYPLHSSPLSHGFKTNQMIITLTHLLSLLCVDRKPHMFIGILPPPPVKC